MRALKPNGFHFYEDGAKWLARGVTYGPFRPDSKGRPYPPIERVREDFAAIAAVGANSLRLYEFPDERLAAAAADNGLRLLLDIPWPKHLDVYEDSKSRAMCLRMTEERLRMMEGWPNLLGLLLGNEIPADLVRWSGTRKVESFLRNLYERAKELAPELPIGYANYPSTEFLRPGFFDFLGFNVYLNDTETFRKYLTRLRLQYPEKPLLLSEVGLDTQASGEAEQAEHLSASLEAAYEVGMAGAFVFSWTDEWHTGGFDIKRWSFGLVDEQRRPKPALQAVADCFSRAPRCAVRENWPKVSVVVATYNGTRTLRACLESLGRLNYPDYEVVVVDDGSTDGTPEILGDFPNVSVIRQRNFGLSVARNTGIHAARGEIVAFTDSDCVADPDWLHHLVAAMERGGFAGMGGPNLTPPENRAVARAIALAPGHASHVLISESEAEHVPGCNMAFRREALLSIGGFNPIYRKAGDDVDLIWRLQDKGLRIGFSTAAFVWHHRRPTFKAYLRQQIGYGEAESLLLWRHPHRFNDRGQSIWRGVIYAGAENSALFGGPNVHYGVFGSADYQCLYERPAGLLPHLLTSIEWWVVSLALVLGGFFSETSLNLGLMGAGLALATAAIKAWKRWSDSQRPPLSELPLVCLLWILQPIYRGGSRYWFRWKTRAPSSDFRAARAKSQEPRMKGRSKESVLEHWSENGPERVDVLRALISRMSELRWLFTPGNGWEPWDLSVAVSWWFKVRLTTAAENHGQEKRLLRMRFRLAPTSLFGLFAAAGLLLSGAVAMRDALWARFILIALILAGWFLYRRAQSARDLIAAEARSVLASLGYAPMGKREVEIVEKESRPSVEANPEMDVQ